MEPTIENGVEQETVEAQGIHALLSCERCKRRKIKCDRTKPTCRSCVKCGRSCSYPTVAQKPGPKPGAPQRKKRRLETGLNGSAHAPLTFKNYSPASSNNKDSNENTDILNLNAHGQLTFGLTTIRPQYQARSSDSTRLDVILNQVDPQLQTQTSSVPDPEPSSRRGLALSQLLHPSHEPVQQMRSQDDPPKKSSISKDAVVESICRDLNISQELFHSLLSAYFDNMTAFSLFHRPTFLTRLCIIPSSIRRALIAAIFAFSSRFIDTNPSNESQTNLPSPESFLAIAEASIDEALNACLDDSPPLCLLQALILTTFYQLIKGVRGRSWRSVGTCVRIAYDMKLHIIDKVMPSTGKSNPEFSCLNALDEERRRAWWAIWEFDVFASTVRRLPTAIDWYHNETWLPMDDELWFAGACSKSCYLNRDTTQAWKDLEKTGNKSPKAWFIVVNALMRCTLYISYPQISPTSHSSASRTVLSIEANLDIHANALYCLSSAIPSTVSYQQEFLTFTKSHSKSSIQIDSAKHAIQIMTQLCRFIIYHYRVFNSTSIHLSKTNPSSSSSSTPAQLDLKDQAAWNQYLAAANEIITLVRNSSPNHVKYVNPFLSSAIWLAAAAQVAARSFGGLLVDKRVVESNLDLLQMNLSGYVNFWGVSTTLQQNLENLESQLEGFRNETEGAEGLMAVNGNFQTNDQYGGEREAPAQYGNQELPNAQVAQLQTPNTENNELSRFDVESWMPDENILGDATNLWGWGLEDLLNYGGVDANLGVL